MNRQPYEDDWKRAVAARNRRERRWLAAFLAFAPFALAGSWLLFLAAVSDDMFRMGFENGAVVLGVGFVLAAVIWRGSNVPRTA